MRIKGLSVLLSAVIACSVIFTSCGSETPAESKKTAESSSETISKKDASSSSKDSSYKEVKDNSEDTSQKEDTSSDDEKGTLTKIKNAFKKTAKKITDEINASDKENDGKYHVGDVVSFDNFKITYKSIQKYKSNNQFIQPKKGFQYIKYTFSFKNTGKDDSYVGNFSCYADGEQCDSAYVDDSSSSLLLTKLSAGRKKSGSIIFEVPKNVKLKKLELEYESSSLWSDEKIIFLGE